MLNDGKASPIRWSPGHPLLHWREGSIGAPGQLATPLVWVKKMTTEDDLEAFLNTFE